MALQQSNKKVGEVEDNLSIGQVVYILSGKGQAILPARIIERAVIQTLDDKSVTWKLAIGRAGDPDRPQKIVDSKKINGEIYSSLEEIQSVLNGRLSSFIQKLISTARQREETWYGKKPSAGSALKKAQADLPVREPQQIDPETLLEEMSGEGSDIAVRVHKENLKDRLKEMVTVDEESFDALSDVEDSFDDGEPLPEQNEKNVRIVTGPDGEKYKIHINENQ